MIEFEGERLEARTDDSVAAALLMAGHTVFRTTPVSGAERGPFCMMGVCFECLVEIDGVGNQQACMIEVRQGMRIKRQQGAVEIRPDRNDGAIT
jgi:predicted molibdopterin-dependent oxidoreductase YjgC